MLHENPKTFGCSRPKLEKQNEDGTIVTEQYSMFGFAVKNLNHES